MNRDESDLHSRIDSRLSAIWNEENSLYCKGQVSVERWDCFTFPDDDGLVRFMVPEGLGWSIQASVLDKMTDEEIVEWVEVQRAMSLIVGL